MIKIVNISLVCISVLLASCNSSEENVSDLDDGELIALAVNVEGLNGELGLVVENSNVRVLSDGSATYDVLVDDGRIERVYVSEQPEQEFCFILNEEDLYVDASSELSVRCVEKANIGFSGDVNDPLIFVADYDSGSVVTAYGEKDQDGLPQDVDHIKIVDEASGDNVSYFYDAGAISKIEVAEKYTIDFQSGAESGTTNVSVIDLQTGQQSFSVIGGEELDTEIVDDDGYNLMNYVAGDGFAKKTIEGNVSGYGNVNIEYCGLDVEDKVSFVNVRASQYNLERYFKLYPVGNNSYRTKQLITTGEFTIRKQAQEYAKNLSEIDRINACTLKPGVDPSNNTLDLIKNLRKLNLISLATEVLIEANQRIICHLFEEYETGHFAYEQYIKQYFTLEEIDIEYTAYLKNGEKLTSKHAWMAGSEALPEGSLVLDSDPVISNVSVSNLRPSVQQGYTMHVEFACAAGRTSKLSVYGSDGYENSIVKLFPDYSLSPSVQIDVPGAWEGGVKDELRIELDDESGKFNLLKVVNVVFRD